MIRVKPMARGAMDDWLIADSGLPPRVAHVCEARGLRRIGELRHLADARNSFTPGLGASSVRHVRQFFSICADIEAGRCVFPDVEALLNVFLRPGQREVLELRYVLRRPPSPETAPATTLQAVGNRRQVCRERIRQMERNALDILRRQQAAACLEPVQAFFADALRAERGVAEPDRIGALPDPGFFGAYQPAAILALLCDCSSRLTCHNGFFAAFPPAVTRDIEAAVDHALSRPEPALPLAQIVKAVPPVPGFQDPAAHAHIVGVVLRHMPGMSVTADEYVFRDEAGAAVIMERVMRRLPVPVHFRLLQAEFNAGIRTGKRQGSGFILGVLRNSGRFQPAGNGYMLRDRNPAGSPPPAPGSGTS